MGIVSLIAYLSMTTIETRTKIAVIDTGIHPNTPNISQFLCKEGHKDFTYTGLMDNIGHGSIVTQLITKSINQDKSCVIILKWIDDRTKGDTTQIVQALNYAISIKVDYINMSLSGIDSKTLVENYLLDKATTLGIKVFVAAGNDNLDLGKRCNVYPACYKIKRNFVVVGNNNGDSNYNGPVSRKENGLVMTQSGLFSNGTSNSCAIATGLEVKKNEK